MKNNEKKKKIKNLNDEYARVEIFQAPCWTNDGICIASVDGGRKIRFSMCDHRFYGDYKDWCFRALACTDPEHFKQNC